jgi:hypothetical protein
MEQLHGHAPCAKAGAIRGAQSILTRAENEKAEHVASPASALAGTPAHSFRSCAIAPALRFASIAKLGRCLHSDRCSPSCIDFTELRLTPAFGSMLAFASILPNFG